MPVANLTVPEELLALTFMVRHNPNCPMPFEVRLTGIGLLLDQQRYVSKKNRDDVGYGVTLFNAAQAALEAKQFREDAPKRAQAAKVFGELWNGL